MCTSTPSADRNTPLKTHPDGRHILNSCNSSQLMSAGKRCIIVAVVFSADLRASFVAVAFTDWDRLCVILTASDPNVMDNLLPVPLVIHKTSSWRHRSNRDDCLLHPLPTAQCLTTRSPCMTVCFKVFHSFYLFYIVPLMICTSVFRAEDLALRPIVHMLSCDSVLGGDLQTSSLCSSFTHCGLPFVCWRRSKSVIDVSNGGVIGQWSDVVQSSPLIHTSDICFRGLECPFSWI